MGLDTIALVHFVWVELALFSAIGFLIGGTDEILVDLLYVFRTVWRRIFIYSRHRRATAGKLVQATVRPRFAVFVPAWQEANVLAQTISEASTCFLEHPVHVFVGIYRNDPEGIAVARAHARANVSMVLVERDGPTSKADCLNHIWKAMRQREAETGQSFEAVVLHDVEDVIAPQEYDVFAGLIDRFEMIQLPVVPFPDPESLWVAGHYCDEFAEHHFKTLPVREAIGASLPAAGVGCIFRRDALEKLDSGRGPFNDDSLTEDYELGLRIAEMGGRGAIVRLAAMEGGPVIGTRAHFPDSFDAAVRQKSRWIAGIVLLGWDRMGWGRSVAENWMRFRDRLSLFAALIFLSAYASLLLFAVEQYLLVVSGAAAPPMAPGLQALLVLNGAMLMWRLAFRASFTGRLYGWRQAVLSIPRAFVGNIIAIAASRRAVSEFLKMRRQGRIHWEKTAHKRPRRGA